MVVLGLVVLYHILNEEFRLSKRYYLFSLDQAFSNHQVTTYNTSYMFKHKSVLIRIVLNKREKEILLVGKVLLKARTIRLEISNKWKLA